MLLAVRSVAQRGVWRDGARRESFLFQGEQCLNQSVCVRAGRAAGYALWAGRKMSTAPQVTRVTLLAACAAVVESRSRFWLVALTLHNPAPRPGAFIDWYSLMAGFGRRPKARVVKPEIPS